ncbi:hypothetical protein TNIN_260711 [Trichonephila inaurata madagascariensis]|uniref:Uncharacterized protein n=1 Tax=Trichonephila inaurata madagascariensis TaxID=2747483 RepID=A0A8X6Y0Y0_9ARAC|nr:hypothetical protein TNIN_369641 [Trichonephila inaurata madagascariensis]GFY70921.1 hypothetical protein TNIN_260711 [Trichonephila inaurata madagascariensis]
MGPKQGHLLDSFGYTYPCELLSLLCKRRKPTTTKLRHQTSFEELLFRPFPFRREWNISTPHPFSSADDPFNWFPEPVPSLFNDNRTVEEA